MAASAAGGGHGWMRDEAECVVFLWRERLHVDEAECAWYFCGGRGYTWMRQNARGIFWCTLSTQLSRDDFARPFDTDTDTIVG